MMKKIYILLSTFMFFCSFLSEVTVLSDNEKIETSETDQTINSSIRESDSMLNDENSEEDTQYSNDSFINQVQDTSEKFVSEQTSSSKTSDSIDKEPSSKINSAKMNPEITALASPLPGDTIVNTWTDFKKALESSSVQSIFVNQNLTASSKVIVNGSKNIEFNDKYLDIKKNDLTINIGNKVTISNLTINGSVKNGYIFKGTGAITFTNNLTSSSINAGVIAQMTTGSISLDAVNMKFDSSSTSELFQSKNFTITNKSNVQSSAQKFFGIVSNPGSRASVVINSESKVNTTSMKGVTDGQAWNILYPTEFTVQGENTVLNIEGNGTRTATNGGVFLLVADGSNINILNNAKMNATAWDRSCAILLQSEFGSLNVKNNAELNVVQENDGNYNLNAAVRFRDKGSMTFNVTNKSKINIQKKLNLAGGPAVRMYGGNNSINISGGSDFIVYNRGNGKVSDGGGDGDNPAIQYRSGNKTDLNSFNVDGANSNISLTAEFGPAMDSNGSPLMLVSIGKNAYFVARGATKTADKGIFQSGNTMNFTMEEVKYYDFRNNNRGAIFNSNGKISSFKSTNSDVSVWKKTANLNGSATYTWNQVDFSLTGINLNNLANSSSATMTSQFGLTSSYSRMSANNQNAIVDQLRVPTNADKSLFAHVSIPEGKYDDPRSANNNEASARINVYDPDGTSVRQLTGNTKTISIYGEAAAPGWVKVTLPNNNFLIEDYKAKVTSAWLGDSSTPSQSQRPSKAEDIKTGEVKVYAVVPPLPAKVANNNLDVTATSISGTATPNVSAFLYLNGTYTNISVAVSSLGTFALTLPQGLKKGDQLQILLRDKKGKVEGVINPPSTNGVNGNIEPMKEMIYHDATFPAGTILTVVGNLSLTKVPTSFNFGTQVIKPQVQTIWPTVSGDLIVTDSRSNPQGWQVKLTETKPFTNSAGNQLTSVLYFQDGTSSKDKVLGTSSQTVYQQTVSQDKDYVITSDWEVNKNKGIKMIVPVEKQVIGNYEATLNWSLEVVPDN